MDFFYLVGFMSGLYGHKDEFNCVLRELVAMEKKIFN